VSETLIGPSSRLLTRLPDKVGQVFVAGECQSVGFSGGYIQGGGHGPFSTLYGMGSDQALEFTLVTANGKHVTASTTSYPDLFWALRGGGPAAWGVITSVTVKTFTTLKMAGAVLNFGTMDTVTFWSGIDAFHAGMHCNIYCTFGLD
jgi:FAD/FMN-containing dehydrogenase